MDTDAIWAKMYGLFDQVWCRVRWRDGVVELAFFDDDKQIFHHKTYSKIEDALSALVINDFRPNWDLPMEVQGNRFRSRQAT